MQCPACNGKLVKTIRVTVYQCRKCEAVFGSCYLGDSYGYVLPYFAKEAVEPDQLRYYDFECLGSAGITRRHGWYDPATKLVHQTG